MNGIMRILTTHMGVLAALALAAFFGLARGHMM
jgi:hypothetical protein